MKTASASLVDTMEFVTDRAMESMIAETGQSSTIGLYSDGDDIFDMATKAGEDSADVIYNEIFAKQRAAISKMLYETITEIATKDLGNADLALDIKLDDDDIDELLMLSLDPAFASQAPAEEKENTPSAPIPEIAKENGNG